MAWKRDRGWVPYVIPEHSQGGRAVPGYPPPEEPAEEAGWFCGGEVE